MQDRSRNTRCYWFSVRFPAPALANGYVTAKTSVNTSEAVYNSWYDAVYEPQQSALLPDA